MAEPARQMSERHIDVIDTRPAFTQEEADALNARFEGVDTLTMLKTVFAEGLAGNVAVVSSFGTESAVLLDLVARADRTVPVIFVDTLKMFAETLNYRDTLIKRLGFTDSRTVAPLPDVIAKKDETGLRWSYDPDGCCEIRKVRPLETALAGYDASFTGRKAFQSATRANLPRFEIDTSDAQGRLKINPLIDWDADRIAAYFEEHDLPRHPLVERGFPSIGCSPCTRPVGEGEDPRAGRWSGWDKVECGIHRPGEEPFL